MPVSYLPQITTSSRWGDIAGNIDNQTDLKQILDNKSDTSHTHPDLYETIGSWEIKGIPFFTTEGKQFVIILQSLKVPFQRSDGTTGNISIGSCKLIFINAEGISSAMPMSNNKIPFYNELGQFFLINMVI
jgi:hypothetical protein